MLVVMNKMDLPVLVKDVDITRALQAAGRTTVPAILRLSLKTGAGLPELKAALVEHLGVERQAPAHPTVAERHCAELMQTDQALAKGREQLSGDDTQLVLAAGELRQAAEALGRITGRNYTHDLLDLIFSRFCLGK